jgi:hypothetical protein
MRWPIAGDERDLGGGAVLGRARRCVGAHSTHGHLARMRRVVAEPEHGFAYVTQGGGGHEGGRRDHGRELGEDRIEARRRRRQAIGQGGDASGEPHDRRRRERLDGCAQHGPRAVEDLAGGHLAHAQLPRDRGVGGAADGADHRRALRLGQSGHGPQGRAELLAMLDHLGAPAVLGLFVQHGMLGGGPRRQFSEGNVSGDAMQPWRQLAHVGPAPQGLEGAQEGQLDGVVDLVGGQQRAAVALERAPVTIDDGGERGLAPLPR